MCSFELLDISSDKNIKNEYQLLCDEKYFTFKNIPKSIKLNENEDTCIIAQEWEISEQIAYPIVSLNIIDSTREAVTNTMECGQKNDVSV